MKMNDVQVDSLLEIQVMKGILVKLVTEEGVREKREQMSSEYTFSMDSFFFFFAISFSPLFFIFSFWIGVHVSILNLPFLCPDLSSSALSSTSSSSKEEGTSQDEVCLFIVVVDFLGFSIRNEGFMNRMFFLFLKTWIFLDKDEKKEKKTWFVDQDGLLNRVWIEVYSIDIQSQSAFRVVG